MTGQVSRALESGLTPSFVGDSDHPWLTRPRCGRCRGQWRRASANAWTRSTAKAPSTRESTSTRPTERRCRGRRRRRRRGDRGRIRARGGHRSRPRPQHRLCASSPHRSAARPACRAVRSSATSVSRGAPAGRTFTASARARCAGEYAQVFAHNLRPGLESRREFFIRPVSDSQDDAITAPASGGR